MAGAGFVTRLLQPCAVAAFSGLLAACGGGDGGEPARKITTVSVSSAASTLNAGESIQLSALARDEAGNVVACGPVAWSVSEPSVASISAEGRLQALAGGTVLATATVGDARGWVALVVWPFAAESVTVTSPALSLHAGDTVQLAAVVRNRLGATFDSATAAWSTSDSRVATVTPRGLLQALAPGSVVATATAYGASGSLPLTVVPGTVASVTVSAPTLTPKEGDTVQLTATAFDQFGNIVPGVAAAWSVSDAALAAVSATGLLQTYATGTVQATASVGGMSGTVSLTVSTINVSVTIGAKEVVYRYATERCWDLDTPDQPPRMVRADDGSLVLFAANAPRAYVSRGVDFGSLKRDCSGPVLVSADRTTPESYESQEWIWVVYRDGNRWHALISNEYHDPFASTCQVGDTGPANPCWYNSITHAVSTDSARSFTKPSAPAHVVAPPPNVWVPPAPGTPPSDVFPQGKFAEGYFGPSNMVRGGDGFFYAILHSIPSRLEPSAQGLCAIRTDDLDDPARWRAWDGNGYNLRMTSPYVTGGPAPMCTFLKEIGPGTASLTFNSYLGRYMRFGNNGPGAGPCGFYLTLSSDLVHWSSSQLAVDVNMYGCASLAPSPVEPVNVLFPAIVDHTDTTINFERAGQTAFLYYVRYNRKVDDPLYWLDRDVVRVPITFTRID